MTGPNVFKTTFNPLLVMQNGTRSKEQRPMQQYWYFLFCGGEKGNFCKGKVWVSRCDCCSGDNLWFSTNLRSPSTFNNLQFWWGCGRSQFVITMLLLYCCFLTIIFFVVTLNFIHLRHLLKRKSGIHPLTLFFRFTPFVVFNKRQFGVRVGEKMKIAAVTANGIVPRGPP